MHISLNPILLYNITQQHEGWAKSEYSFPYDEVSKFCMEEDHTYTYTYIYTNFRQSNIFV
jgi:hypothetical protein